MLEQEAEGEREHFLFPCESDPTGVHYLALQCRDLQEYRGPAFALPDSCITVEPMTFLMCITCFHHKNISLLNIHFIVFVDLSVGHVLLHGVKAALWL